MTATTTKIRPLIFTTTYFSDTISSDDCTTAGGHYNPTGKKHGSLYGDQEGDLTARHVGDLGNFKAGEG